MSEFVAPQPTAVSIQPIAGEAYKVSDCHLAPVENKVEQVPNDEGGDWWASTHVCTLCGQECLVHTNPAYVGLLQENAALKEQIANGA